MASGPSSPNKDATNKPGRRLRTPMGSASAKTLMGMSIQAQLELNDIPPYANEPGPGHYFAEGSVGFSSLGDQPMARCKSEPKVSFPQTGWPQWEKIVVTKAHATTNKCRESSGHPYAIPDDGLSKKSTKIGSSLRPDLAAQLGAGNGSPGPAYNTRFTPDGDVPNPEDRMHAPTNSLAGKSERFPPSRGVNPLGPGEYRSPNSLKLETGRSFGISRSAYDKVISPGWEDVGLCEASPGVGPPLRRDPKDGSRACPMGRAERFPKAAGGSVPGPGQYRQDERDLGHTYQRGSILSMAKRAESFSFGKPPKKPRFRMQLATNTATRGGWGYF